MKVIDPSTNKGSGSQLGALGRAMGDLNLPFGSKKETRDQEVITSTLSKVLDNRFYLLRNVELEGLDVSIPLVLVGPTGLWVIYTRSTKGIFRATESTWEEFDERTSQFRPGKPDLLARTILYARAVERFLSIKGLETSTIEPVLFFSDPGVHVNSSRPEARIVIADGLQRFVASLIRVPLILDLASIQKIVDALTEDQGGGSVDSIEEMRDAFSYKELPKKKPACPSPIAEKLSTVGRGEPAFAKKVSSKNPFNRRQWLVIGLLALFLAILLIVMIFVFLIYSPVG